MNSGKPKTKVLFLLPALTTGGAEKVLITLMNNLDRERYEPLFLSISDQGEIGRLIDENIKLQTLGVKLSVTALPKLYGHVKATRPDIIISTMAHMNFAVLLLKPFFKHTKFVVREAITPSFFRQKGKVKSAIISLLFKRLYPRADMVLSPTRLVFKEFEQELGLRLHNARLLPNSIGEQSIRADLQNPYTGDEKHQLKLVACGRLHQQKGFDRLIEALSTAKLQGDWRLDILGEGDQRQLLERQIESVGFSERIFLKGLVKNPENYFAYSDCVLMPSRYEGLPNVVLEALACGTPVIATASSGGISEIETVMKTDDLKVVQSMAEFAEKMCVLQPRFKETPELSLLPHEFERKGVLALFHSLLEDLA